MKKLIPITFLFLSIVLLAVTACKKKDDPSPSGDDNNQGQTNPNARFFRAKIDADSINYTENINNTVGTNGVSHEEESTDSWLVHNAAVLHPIQGIKNNLSLLIGNTLLVDGKTKCTDEQFNALFTEGSMSYSASSGNKDFSGVMFNWFDNDAKIWYTIGDQTGSTFTIDKVTRIAATNSADAQVIVEATFSCTLYNLEHNATKTLKNGKLKLTFQNFDSSRF